MGLSGMDWGRWIDSIDRFFMNPSWCLLYLDAKVSHLTRCHSDHCLVLLKTNPSSKDHLFMGHRVSSLHILKRDYFSSSESTIFLKFSLCVFTFPHLLNFPQNYFSQNLFYFSYFYRGRSSFLTFVIHREGCCSS